MSTRRRATGTAPPPTLSTPALVAGGVSLALAGLYLYLRTKTDDVFGDISDVIRLLGVRRQLIAAATSKQWSIVDVWNQTVKNNPTGDCFHFVDENVTYTFKQADEITNQIANWAAAEGIKRGDVVALYMDNRPEYVFTWLGLAKVGAVTALINHNLTGRTLEHSLTVCKASRFIFGSEYGERAQEAKQTVPGQYYSYGGFVEGTKHLDELFATQDKTPPPVSLRAGCTANDVLFYIYTSGTTGAPKASVIKHIRFYIAAMGFAVAAGVEQQDRIYCALPLYHSAGGMIGVGLCVYGGSCLVFRKRFSASKYWPDVREHNCTVVQYIGELCRYLCAVPPTPEDGNNKCRLAIGNGLRPDVWPVFQKRFNIDRVCEFYAATEGNASLLNTKNKQGAVGYISPLIQRVYPVKIIKFDQENETPIRNKEGLCIECEPGEPGELLGKIDNDDPTRAFDGYTDKEATERKILSDVFEKGDSWFRSGDLLKRDNRGYYYFVDRIGDTFRWKGENVATSDVSLAISAVPGVVDCNVYGVVVPGHDGRAGAAALLLDDALFDWKTLYDTIQRDLPSYARPLFVRKVKQLDMTGTVKHQKFTLKKEGFDPSVAESKGDQMYFRDDSKGEFVRIDQELYQRICAGTLAAKL